MRDKRSPDLLLMAHHARIPQQQGFALEALRYENLELSCQFECESQPFGEKPYSSDGGCIRAELALVMAPPSGDARTVQTPGRRLRRLLCLTSGFVRDYTKEEDPQTPKRNLAIAALDSSETSEPPLSGGVRLSDEPFAKWTYLTSETDGKLTRPSPKCYCDASQKLGDA